MSTLTFFRLCSRAPSMPSRWPLPVRRAAGVGIASRPERYLPVSVGARRSVGTVPACTTWPPASPAPGPRSTTKSAASMVSWSCSTTMTVLPKSRSRRSVSSSRALSRWWSPIDGSSRT
jgi:hypothetical protein